LVKNKIDVDAGARRREHDARQTYDAPQVAIIEQSSSCLHNGGLVGAEQLAFIEHNAAAAARLEDVNDFVEEITPALRRSCGENGSANSVVGICPIIPF